MRGRQVRIGVKGKNASAIWQGRRIPPTILGGLDIGKAGIFAASVSGAIEPTANQPVLLFASCSNLTSKRRGAAAGVDQQISESLHVAGRRVDHSSPILSNTSDG